jgi:endonuclease/exonuclease/phosphatase (EEP) superfamily protein YafD
LLVPLTALVAGVLAGGVFASARLSAPSPAFAAFTAAQPWIVLCFAVWCGLLLLWAWARPAAWLLFVAVLGGWTLRWGLAWVPWRSEPEGLPLTVLSWNVQRLGWQRGADSPVLRCVTEVVTAAKPDALVFLEVSAQDTDRLSAALGLDCAQIDYAGSGSPSKGGVATCARGPDFQLRVKKPRRYVETIDWYYVFAEVVGRGVVFNLLAIHLQPYRLSVESSERISRAQRAETEALLDTVRTFRDPTIVAGDFNSVRDSALHHAMRRSLTDTFERGGWGPGWTVKALGRFPLRIDYVYVSDDFAVSEATILPFDCSDHRPVLSRLVLRGP